MKLGELKSGDKFWFVSWNSGHIDSIKSYIVDSIEEIKIGRLIRYNDDGQYIHAFAIEKFEYNETKTSAYYMTEAYSDESNVLETLCKDKERFMEKWHNLYKNFMNK